jgi:hypothetical protein
VTDRRVAEREFAAALERFAARFGQPATVVRVPLRALITSWPGVQIDPVRTVQPGEIWPGAVLVAPGPPGGEAAEPDATDAGDRPSAETATAGAGPARRGRR